MESILPILFGCIAPMVWTALVFLAGRWSKGKRIVDDMAYPAPQASRAPYYESEEYHAR